MERAFGDRLSAIGRAACLALAACLGCGGPAPSSEMLGLSGPTMGTTYSVKLVIDGRPADADAITAAIDERLKLVNRRMSTYDPASELSRFNASESNDWFEVSRETASVTLSALELAADSDGAYDPTVGPLVKLWGFGPGKRCTEPPTDDEVSAAKAAVGYAKLEARLDPPALRKSVPGVYLDLSSIAKGHGVDAVAELLDEQGFTAYLVEIGGEVRTKGTKPGELPWRIGVEKVSDAPPVAGRQLQRVVELTGESMATSGDYRNFFEHEGVRYSHTISPATGRPVTHNLATVTVLADSCREADGLATALLVLGPGAGYDWAEQRGVAALFVTRTQGDTLTERATPAWESHHAQPETTGAEP